MKMLDDLELKMMMGSPEAEAEYWQIKCGFSNRLTQQEIEETREFYNNITKEFEKENRVFLSDVSSFDELERTLKEREQNKRTLKKN